MSLHLLQTVRDTKGSHVQLPLEQSTLTPMFGGICWGNKGDNAAVSMSFPFGYPVEVLAVCVDRTGSNLVMRAILPVSLRTRVEGKETTCCIKKSKGMQSTTTRAPRNASDLFAESD